MGHRQKAESNLAFTLTELLVVISVLGVLASLSIFYSQSILNERRVKALALDFAGWLEEIRSGAMSQTSQVDGSGGCQVTLYPASQASNAYQMATVTPTSCSKRSVDGSFKISDPSSGKYSIVSNETTIYFTPRGSLVSSNLADVNVIIYRLSSGPMACVQATGVLGIIRTAYNASANSSSETCPVNSFTAF